MLKQFLKTATLKLKADEVKELVTALNAVYNSRIADEKKADGKKAKVAKATALPTGWNEDMVDDKYDEYANVFDGPKDHRAKDR